MDTLLAVIALTESLTDIVLTLVPLYSRRYVQPCKTKMEKKEEKRKNTFFPRTFFALGENINFMPKKIFWDENKYFFEANFGLSKMPQKFVKYLVVDAQLIK